MPKSNSKFLIVAAFFSIYVIWGSTYLLNKIAVHELSPFFLAAIRFSTAGSLIFIICAIIGIPIKITRKQLINTGIAGFLFLAFGNGIVVWALKYVDSGFAALVISGQPLVVLLLMRIFQGKKIHASSLVGVFLGIFGIYLLISQNHIMDKDGSVLGIIMIFCCMLSWGYGSLFVGTANLPSNFFVNTGYQMILAGIMLFIASLTFGEVWISPFDWSKNVQLSLVALIIFGSIVAFTSFNYLLRIISPEKVATSTYVNPIIALFLGWYFLKEEITTQSMFATIILLSGVYFINTKKKLVIFSRFAKFSTKN